MKVLVAMSGGVDSSVTAYLLKEQGYEVTGATIRTWASEDCPNLNTRACCGVSGVTDARSVARVIDIPYYVFNFEREFKAAVVDYFTREYLRGRTPNPCIVCNQKIKFRLFLKRARTMGIETIATGHYASVHHDEASGRYLVREGLDKRKDQSYVLFALSQEELGHLRLPLGSYRKDEIREIARELGLCVSDKPDSQEICFIPSNDYGEFLTREMHLEENPGQIRDGEGNVLGTHPGYFHFTLGQRKGLGVAHGKPLYVNRINPDRNEVVVGPKESVRRREFWVSELNWLAEMNGTETFRCEVKIRSNFRKAPATVEKWVSPKVTVTKSECHLWKVMFDEPQEAITPGQAAVFYEDDLVIGGGWIEAVT